MTSSDQLRALEIVGLGTTSKFLSNAYPLGGYHGLEVSLSVETIDTSEIARMGATAPEAATTHYPTFTIGKGIYNNSDIFFHFVPASKTSGISKYGASYRWAFYEALFLPLNFSVVGHVNSSNLRNQMLTRNLGADLLIGMTLTDFSFFIGGGWANSTGRFIGGTNGVTLSGVDERQKVDSSHFMFGATYNFDPIFVGLSVDRYQEAVYTLKSGFLF